MNIRFVIPEQTIAKTIYNTDSNSIGYIDKVKGKFDELKAESVEGFVLMFEDEKEVKTVMDKMLINPTQDIFPAGEEGPSVASPCWATEARIENALRIAGIVGQVEGDHHKAWVIDQMVRALCGCMEYTDGSFASNQEYRDWIEHYCYVDGEQEYEWDTGIAP